MELLVSNFVSLYLAFKSFYHLEFTFVACQRICSRTVDGIPRSSQTQAIVLQNKVFDLQLKSKSFTKCAAERINYSEKSEEKPLMK